MNRLVPVPLGGGSEEKDEYTVETCSGSEQWKPQTGHPSPGVLHRGDELPWLIGGPLGLTGGLWAVWAPLMSVCPLLAPRSKVERAVRRMLKWLLGLLQLPQCAPPAPQPKPTLQLTYLTSHNAQDLGLPQPGRKFGDGMQRQHSPRTEPELGRGSSRCWHVLKRCIRSSPQLWWWLFYQRPHQDIHWGSTWALPALHWDPTTVILDNLEMDKFLETYKMSRLTQEETNNLNRLITSSEIEFVIKKQNKTKNLLVNKSLGPDGFTGEFYLTYKEELIPTLLKLFLKMEKMEHSQIHSMRPPLPWYQNQKKTLEKRTLQASIFCNYKCKNHQNISKPNHKKDCIPWSNKIYSKDTRLFEILKLMNVIHYFNKRSIKKQNHLNRCRKSIWQNSISIHKNSQSEYKENISQHDKNQSWQTYG